MGIAANRLRRVQGLVKSVKHARRLVRASPYAVGLWGVEAVGLTPSFLCAFRTRVAAASGINQARRCPTTAIYVAFGLDPLEDLMRRMLVSFYSWAAVIPIRRLAPAWKVIHDGLVHDGLFTWSKAEGHIGALIGMLHHIGWSA